MASRTNELNFDPVITQKEYRTMKQFETNVFKMDIHDDGFIDYVIKQDTLVEAKDFWLAKQMTIEYMPGRKFYLLMESEGLFQITMGARDLGASKEYSDHLAAVALYSNNLTLKIIGNLYIKLKRPAAPTKFFDDRDKAIAWLREQMKGQ
jgi:hypothetical protein